MTFIPSYFQHRYIQTILLVLLGSVLLFPRLDDTYLWLDEAETALLGKNILTYGYPRMYDGRNLMTYYPPLHNEDYVEVVLPWLPYYVSAASFYFLGVDTFSSRFPFVICGLVVIGLFPVVVRQLTDDRWTQIVAPWVLVMNVPLLLYFRQCRYYGLVIVFTLLLIWSYLNLANGRKWALWPLTLAAIGLFHSHYVVCAGTLAGLGMHWLMVYFQRISWTQIAIMGALFALFTIPWVWYAQFWTHGYVWFSASKFFIFMGTLTAKLTENFAAPVLISVMGLWIFNRTNRFWRYLCLIGGLCCAGASLNIPGLPYMTAVCVVLALVKGGTSVRHCSLQTGIHLIWMLPAGIILTLSVFSPSNEIRYLVGIAPLVLIAMVMAFSQIRQSFPKLAVVFLLLVMFSNLLNASPALALRALSFSALDFGAYMTDSEWSNRVGIKPLLPPEDTWFHRMAVMDRKIVQLGVVQSYPTCYLYELTHRYDGPLEGIVNYLERHGHPDDTILTDYGSVPLMFYTKMRLLPERLIYEPEEDIQPDWIIMHEGDFLQVTKSLQQVLDTEYERIELQYPDLLWDNRPELAFHYFSVPSDRPLQVIYRRLQPRGAFDNYRPARL
jgi:hypothetical protein